MTLSNDTRIRARQKGIIALDIELGRTIQQDHSEVAELYRQGRTHSQIVAELNLCEVYDVSNKVAKTAVHFALAGYKGHLEWVTLDQYVGLLSNEELDKIATEHNAECGRTIGQETYEKGLGIFSMTPEERSEAGRKGGRVAFEEGTGVFSIGPERRREIASKVGQRHYEQGTGFFSMTPEEKAEVSRKGGQTNYEQGTGIFSMTPEEKSEAGHKGGSKSHEMGVGIHALTHEQRSKIGREAGLKAFDLDVGIHSQTKEERREHGLRTYREGKGIANLTAEQKSALGRRNYLNGIGVHGRTPEQMSEDGRKAALACGFTLWTDNEIHYVHTLAKQPEYQHKDGEHRGRADQKLITGKVNEVFHQGEDVRTTASIKACLKRHK